MSTSSFLVSLLLSAPQDPAPSADVLLATIPEGISIAGEYQTLTNRGRVVARPTLAWSQDGSTVAYAGLRGDEWLPVVGSKLGNSFDYVSTPILAGGQAFFHVGRRLTPNTGHAWVWVDGKLIGPEDWMGDIAVSPDGSKIAYWTQPGALVGSGAPPLKKKCLFAIASKIEVGKWSVTRGEEWVEHDAIRPLFSADGQSVFTCAVGKQGWVLLSRGRREIALCDPCPLIDSLAISRDGAVQAYVRTLTRTGDSKPDPAARDGAELFFRGVRHGKEFPALARPAVDAGGKHVAFVVLAANRQSVVVDSEKKLSGAYDHVFEIAFDPSGRRLAYVANIGGQPSEEIPGLIEGGESFVVVRDVGAGGAALEHARHACVQDLVWDPKGERIAYRVKDEDGWRIVCGDAISEPHDEVGAPYFEGDKLRFGSRDQKQLWWREIRLKGL